jgi:hypothetical protein
VTPRRVGAAELITRFWAENPARESWDRSLVNPLFVEVHRSKTAGWLPALPPIPRGPPQVPNRLRDVLHC